MDKDMEPGTKGLDQEGKDVVKPVEPPCTCKRCVAYDKNLIKLFGGRLTWAKQDFYSMIMMGIMLILVAQASSDLCNKSQMLFIDNFRVKMGEICMQYSMYPGETRSAIVNESILFNSTDCRFKLFNDTIQAAGCDLLNLK